MIASYRDNTQIMATHIQKIISFLADQCFPLKMFFCHKNYVIGAKFPPKSKISTQNAYYLPICRLSGYMGPQTNKRTRLKHSSRSGNSNSDQISADSVNPDHSVRKMGSLIWSYTVSSYRRKAVVSCSLTQLSYNRFALT